MPLFIDGGQIPPRWGERQRLQLPSMDLCNKSNCLRVALINNMPDPALEDTELQFFELLDAASSDQIVILRLYSLTGVPRTDRGTTHIARFYRACSDLWDSEFDAAIITGTEPQHVNLHDEPYWSSLTELLDWAERNTFSTILSCLAAHAGVLHSDGILRRRLPDKRFGIFDFSQACEHSLIQGLSGPIRFPHSRWNDLLRDDLMASGYTVLTEGGDAGVDTFVKRKKKSLFVHFQGHPEYGPQTLLKEYRRDVKRFLQGERETYPLLPKGYIDSQLVRVLDGFQERAMVNRTESLMNTFPENALGSAFPIDWRGSSIRIYENWLHYVRKQRSESAYSVVASFQSISQRKRSALS